MNFLRKAGNYNLQEAISLCETKKFYREIVFLYGETTNEYSSSMFESFFFFRLRPRWKRFCRAANNSKSIGRHRSGDSLLSKQRKSRPLEQIDRGIGEQTKFVESKRKSSNFNELFFQNSSKVCWTTPVAISIFNNWSNKFPQLCVFRIFAIRSVK